MLFGITERRLGDPLTVTMRTSLAAFALKDRLPAMFTHR
jgi:hypothetical protein